MIVRYLISLLLLAGPTPLWAGPLLLEQPIQCTLGQNCFIQQYVDNDASAGARDFTCGPLSYDGHKGTDFRLAHLSQITGDGVAVLAAAAGRVSAVRDRLPDIAQGSTDAPDVDTVECGNGVMLDHDDGWQTQYCHMRLGSISVAPGQLVDAGAELGRVGLSGNTQFPHVHLQVLHNGAVVDPFAPDSNGACGGSEKTLWKSAPAYQPGGILAAGFATSVLNIEQVRAGPPNPASLPPDAPALTYWGFFFGLQKDDVVTIAIMRPDGSILVQQSFAIDRDRAVAYRLSGKKRKIALWPTGTYEGNVVLKRAGGVIDQKSLRVDIK